MDMVAVEVDLVYKAIGSVMGTMRGIAGGEVNSV